MRWREVMDTMARPHFTQTGLSSKRPAGGLGLLRDVFHGLAVTSRASNRGHPSAICPMACGPANGNSNDRCIDHQLCAPDPTARERRLWRGPKGDGEACSGLGLMRLLTQTAPC